MSDDRAQHGDKIRAVGNGITVEGVFHDGPHTRELPGQDRNSYMYGIGDWGTIVTFKGHPEITVLERGLKMPDAEVGDVYLLSGRHGVTLAWKSRQGWDVSHGREHELDVQDPIQWCRDNAGMHPMLVQKYAAEPGGCGRGRCIYDNDHKGKCRESEAR